MKEVIWVRQFLWNNLMLIKLIRISCKVLWTLIFLTTKLCYLLNHAQIKYSHSVKMILKHRSQEFNNKESKSSITLQICCLLIDHHKSNKEINNMFHSFLLITLKCTQLKFCIRNSNLGCIDKIGIYREIVEILIYIHNKGRREAEKYI